jgi:hypothetical protein
MKRLLLLAILAVSITPVIWSSSARSDDAEASAGTSAGTPAADVSYSLEAVPVSDQIRVESKTIAGREVEVVTIAPGDSFTIPVDVMDPIVRDSGLTREEVSEAREQAREALELTLKGVLSDEFSGAMVVGEGGAVTLRASQNGVRAKAANLFKRMFAFNHELYKPMPKDLSLGQKLKRFGQMAWQFIFVETIHAGADYYKNMRRYSPRFNEFGLALDFKIEPQIFIAKFNPTQKFKATSRNWAFYLEISYSRALHKVRLHTRFRKEKGAGGLGLPAVKAELKFFETDGTHKPYKGKSWYPVSPPLLSFVLDSSEHYFAQGITIGINSGDLVPGSTLTNTFNDFVQGQDTFRLVEVPKIASDALNKAAHKVIPHRPPVCSQIFG